MENIKTCSVVVCDVYDGITEHDHKNNAPENALKMALIKYKNETGKDTLEDVDQIVIDFVEDLEEMETIQ